MGNFIYHNGIADNRDWLSGGENLPEILLGYYQHHGGDNEYSYHNLFRKMDKINYSDNLIMLLTSGTCGLYLESDSYVKNWRENEDILSKMGR